jgi:hypothetical protein
MSVLIFYPIVEPETMVELEDVAVYIHDIYSLETRKQVHDKEDKIDLKYLPNFFCAFMTGP